MAALALHTDDAAILRAPQHRRLVQFEVRTLRRGIPLDVAIDAARMQQNARQLRE